eukprot:gene5481-5477_t
MASDRPAVPTASASGGVVQRHIKGQRPVTVPSLYIDPGDFAITFQGPDSPILRRAASRCKVVLFPPGAQPVPAPEGALRLTGLHITTSQPDPSQFVPRDDESYTLSIVAGTASANATTTWALPGLLRFFFFKCNHCLGLCPGQPNGLHAHAHARASTLAPARACPRGLLLDTSRHFMPMTVMKQVLDDMSSTFLNALHWHVVDSPSFPLESKTHPELARHGAYPPSAVYTTEDVQELLAYARDRGIAVVPEFEILGHTES